MTGEKNTEKEYLYDVYRIKLIHPKGKEYEGYTIEMKNLDGSFNEIEQRYINVRAWRRSASAAGSAVVKSSSSEYWSAANNAETLASKINGGYEYFEGYIPKLSGKGNEIDYPKRTMSAEELVRLIGSNPLLSKNAKGSLSKLGLTEEKVRAISRNQSPVQRKEAAQEIVSSAPELLHYGSW